MKLYQSLSSISIIGIFLMTIQILFFKKYFSQSLNNIVLYLLILFLVIFPIAEGLKKRAIKKHENKYH
jgi:hypothetical protein